MADILTPGMDPSLIDTGVPGLSAVTVSRCVASEHYVSVSFSDGGIIYYHPGGVPATPSAGPTLTLKQIPTQVDWSKPIKASSERYGQFARAWVVATDYRPEFGAEPCVAIRLEGVGANSNLLLRTLDNQPIGHLGAKVTIENAPAVTKRTVLKGRDSYDPPRWGPDCTDVVVEYIYTDGILTDAKVVTPNKEPHPCS